MKFIDIKNDDDFYFKCLEIDKIINEVDFIDEFRESLYYISDFLRDVVGIRLDNCEENRRQECFKRLVYMAQLVGNNLNKIEIKEDKR